jgi:hypothetical protein
VTSVTFCDKCSRKVGAIGALSVFVTEGPDSQGRRIVKRLDFCNYHCLAQWAFDQHNYPKGDAA